MMSLPTSGALLAHSNRCLERGQFTGTVGAWSTSPPIAHLGWEQIPTPHAQVTPDAGVIEVDFEAQDADGEPLAFSLDTLGLLAHTDLASIAPRPGLPPGAVVRWLNGATELAAVEYQPIAGRNLPPNVYAVLAASVSLSTLTVRIEDAGADPIRIGGLWAGPSLRFRADRGRPVQPKDYSRSNRADATRWPNRRAITRASDVQASLVEQSQAEAFEGVFEQVGTSRPVIYIHRISTAENRAKTALYGYLEAPAVNHRAGGLYQVQFGVDEVR